MVQQGFSAQPETQPIRNLPGPKEKFTASMGANTISNLGKPSDSAAISWLKEIYEVTENFVVVLKHILLSLRNEWTEKVDGSISLPQENAFVTMNHPNRCECHDGSMIGGHRMQTYLCQLFPLSCRLGLLVSSSPFTSCSEQQEFPSMDSADREMSLNRTESYGDGFDQRKRQDSGDAPQKNSSEMSDNVYKENLSELEACIVKKSIAEDQVIPEIEKTNSQISDALSLKEVLEHKQMDLQAAVESQILYKDLAMMTESNSDETHLNPFRWSKNRSHPKYDIEERKFKLYDEVRLLNRDLTGKSKDPVKKSGYLDCVRTPDLQKVRKNSCTQVSQKFHEFTYVKCSKFQTTQVCEYQLIPPKKIMLKRYLQHMFQTLHEAVLANGEPVFRRQKFRSLELGNTPVNNECVPYLLTNWPGCIQFEGLRKEEATTTDGGPLSPEMFPGLRNSGNSILLTYEHDGGYVCIPVIKLINIKPEYEPIKELNIRRKEEIRSGSTPHNSRSDKHIQLLSKDIGMGLCRSPSLPYLVSDVWRAVKKDYTNGVSNLAYKGNVFGFRQMESIRKIMDGRNNNAFSKGELSFHVEIPETKFSPAFGANESFPNRHGEAVSKREVENPHVCSGQYPPEHMKLKRCGRKAEHSGTLKSRQEIPQLRSVENEANSRGFKNKEDNTEEYISKSTTEEVSSYSVHIVRNSRYSLKNYETFDVEWELEIVSPVGEDEQFVLKLGSLMEEGGVSTNRSKGIVKRSELQDGWAESNSGGMSDSRPLYYTNILESPENFSNLENSEVSCIISKIKLHDRDESEIKYVTEISKYEGTNSPASEMSDNVKDVGSSLFVTLDIQYSHDDYI